MISLDRCVVDRPRQHVSSLPQSAMNTPGDEPQLIISEWVVASQAAGGKEVIRFKN